METTTPFDLNRAIQQWRDNLAQSPAIRAENLDELETHLRDSVARWQSRELSAEEAFLIATKRVGSGTALGKEFGKVNAVNVWVERCLWGLIVMQLWGVIQTVFMDAVYCIQQVNNIVINPDSGWAVSLTGLPIGLSALMLWRLFKSSESKLGFFLERLSSKPLTIAFSMFALSVGVQLFYTYSVHFFNHGLGSISWFSYVYFFLNNVLYAGLLFFLARKRLLRKA